MCGKVKPQILLSKFYLFTNWCSSELP